MSATKYDFKVSVEGNKLYEIRTGLGVTQKKFCEMIGYSHNLLNFCDYIALDKPLTKSMQKDYREKAITNVSAEKIAKNLQLPVDEVFPKYDECAAKRVFPFKYIEDRNAAIEAFFPRIDEMVSKHWWKTYHSADMEELRDVAQLTLVETADKIYKRGIVPSGKDYVKNPQFVWYTEFDGYFIRAIRNSWFKTRRKRKKTSSYTFNSDEKTNNNLFEKMLYNSTERII